MTKETFSGVYQNLGKIGDYVGKAAEDAGLDESGIYAVQLAVDEACTNIIEHAYGGEGIGDITISTQISDEGLTIKLYDLGKPFDPESVPVPQTDLPLEEIKPRGLGLYLMRKVMDDVSFEFSPNNGNTCVLLKRK
jgi:serine/threonine-protein kinase RsbW